MSDTSLPWQIFGRKVRPFSFFLSLSCLVLSWSLLTHRAVGQSLDGVAGTIVGFVALITVLLLWLGYICIKETWMRYGLLAAVGSWTAVGAFLFLEGASPVSASLALCWAGASAGAFLLEVVEKGRRE